MGLPMRTLVVILALLFSLSACDSTGVTDNGGSQSRTEWAVKIGF
jgi:hypothetical protein